MEQEVKIIDLSENETAVSRHILDILNREEIDYSKVVVLVGTSGIGASRLAETLKSIEGDKVIVIEDFNAIIVKPFEREPMKIEKLNLDDMLYTKPIVLEETKKHPFQKFMGSGIKGIKK